MDEKRALQIAYDLLNDELDTQDEEYGYDAADMEYYQIVQDAAKKVKEMIKERE